MANAKEYLPLATIDGGVDNEETESIISYYSSFSSSSSYYSSLATIDGVVKKKYYTPDLIQRIIDCRRFAPSPMAKKTLPLVTVHKPHKKIVQHTTFSPSSSSSMANAKGNLPPVDNKTKDVVDQPHKKIVEHTRSSHSSSSIANAKENLPPVTIQHDVVDPTRNYPAHRLQMIIDCRRSSPPTPMPNAEVNLPLLPLVTIHDDNKKKDADDQPHKKIVKRRRRRNREKKENLISSSSFSSSYSDSLANPKETMPPVSFYVSDNEQEYANYQQPSRIIKHGKVYKYPTMTKVLGDFKLCVVGAQFTTDEIIVMQSKYSNTGKTTFLRLLAGLLKPDTVEGGDMKMPRFNVSYKPPKINPVSRSTVRHLLQQRITHAYNDPHFVSNVMQLLLIEQLLDQQVVNLSYGECQRVELCLCLGKPAGIYLIDEPTTYLDLEMGMAAVKAIRRYIHHSKKTAFVIEPNISRADYVSDRVITFLGKPTIHCSVQAPQQVFLNLRDKE